MCCNVIDLNNRNNFLTAKLVNKTINIINCIKQFLDYITGTPFEISSAQGISEPVFYDDFVYYTYFSYQKIT